MKRFDNVANIQSLLSGAARSISSSTQHSNLRLITKRVSRFRRVAVSFGFSILLVALTLSPSMRGGFSPGSSVSAFDESISTFAADCTSPQPGNTWNLGGTACAKVTGAPADRRIAWIAPDGSVAQVTDFFSGSLTDSYTLQTGTNPLAQVGTWTVQTIDPSGGTFATAEFVVRDPANASANLSIADFGPSQTSAGNNVSYRVELTNRGPDDAQSVAVVSSVPGNTTFVSETQDSGPSFTCTSPAGGSGSGNVSCTIATLPANTTAVFTLVFSVNSDAANETVISNTASVSSTTNDPHQGDNSASASTTVVSATSNCTISCPSVAPVSTSGCSAVVTYSAPSTSGACGLDSEEGGGAVVCSPPSGSVFPVGSTSVSCTAPTGDACSFTVTVQSSGPSNPLSISCPADVTVNSDSVSAGTATVNYPAPTANGNCVTVECVPPSGSAFPVGTTVVHCTATDSSGSTSCNFNVTVNDANPGSCSLNCPGDITLTAAAGQCSATATYAAPTTSGSCGTVTCTPSSGSTFPVGTSLVSCTSTEGGSCDFTVTIVAPAAPTITTCATNRTVPVNADCEGVIPNLLGEVVTTGCNVVVSQSPAAGSVVPAGLYLVVISAENTAGEATCIVTVRVDSAPPVIACPSNISAIAAPGQCAAVVTYANATATDNCSGVVIPVCTPPSGSAFAKGTTTVTCTATDGSGNSASCTFTVAVSDTQPPTIVCQSDLNVDFDPGVGGAVVTYTTPVGTDNCPGATTTQIAGLPSGATFPAGTTTNTFRVTDAAGLTAECSFKVTVALTSLIGLDSVSITGAASVDSYNSSGGYPATKSSLANVLSNGSITLGNSGKVFGNVRSTRAGVVLSGATQVTGNATAGTTVSVSGSSSVGGTITNNQLAPVMTLPSVTACGPPYSPNSGITGTYSYNASTGDLSLSGVNIATLANGAYCFHNVTLTNSAELKVNGPVVIKITGTLNVGGATKLTNTTGVPGNFRILSSFTGSNGVTLANSSNAQLVIYAPRTDVIISGAVPLFGTVVGKTLTISNSGMIHYDILLKSIWPDLWASIQ